MMDETMECCSEKEICKVKHFFNNSLIGYMISIYLFFIFNLSFYHYLEGEQL